MSAAEILKLMGNKFVVTKRSIIREHMRYKIYLPEQYNEIWEEIRRQGRRVDLIIAVRD